LVFRCDDVAAVVVVVVVVEMKELEE